MADDPYETLGVGKSATDAEIKKAYRKLIKTAHPDLNPGDAAAEKRFKKISAAYALLSDPEKRARFDRGEIDASGAEKPHPGYYRDYAGAAGGGRYRSSAGYEDFADMSDLFAEMFGRRAAAGADGRGGASFRASGADARYHFDVDFLDAVNGAKKRITLPDGSNLDLAIPPGLADGETLRLKGKGSAGFGGGPAGDALIEISVRPHPVFERVEDDIVLTLPITIEEAVLGAKVEAPTVSGKVRVAIPKYASSGDALRLKGKGVARKGRPPGDQRIILKIVAPDEPDPELEALLEKRREKSRQDPRAKIMKSAS